VVVALVGVGTGLVVLAVALVVAVVVLVVGTVEVGVVDLATLLPLVPLLPLPSTLLGLTLPALWPWSASPLLGLRLPLLAPLALLTPFTLALAAALKSRLAMRLFDVNVDVTPVQKSIFKM